MLCFQGTFLKEAIGRDLENMGSHEALNKASDKVWRELWYGFFGVHEHLWDTAWDSSLKQTLGYPQGIW